MAGLIASRFILPVRVRQIIRQLCCYRLTSALRNEKPLAGRINFKKDILAAGSKAHVDRAVNESKCCHEGPQFGENLVGKNMRSNNGSVHRHAKVHIVVGSTREDLSRKHSTTDDGDAQVNVGLNVLLENHRRKSHGVQVEVFFRPEQSGFTPREVRKQRAKAMSNFGAPDLEKIQDLEKDPSSKLQALKRNGSGRPRMELPTIEDHELKHCPDFTDNAHFQAWCQALEREHGGWMGTGTADTWAESLGTLWWHRWQRDRDAFRYAWNEALSMAREGRIKDSIGGTANDQWAAATPQ